VGEQVPAPHRKDDPVNLETSLERSTPTRAQWDAWTHHESSLAGLAYRDLRRELRTGSQDRKDELLGAFVRLVQADPGAFGVLTACLLPGLCHRVARYAPSLDHQEALAVMVAALYESTVRYDLELHPRFVAAKLLARPTRRLRHTVSAHRTWSAHWHESDIGSDVADPELSPHALLAPAVEAGVLTQHDARLIFDTRIAGHTLPEAARQLGLRYETAKMRRRRAEARWATWWLRDTGHAGTRGDGKGAA
jgi:hypothetical protein